VPGNFLIQELSLSPLVFVAATSAAVFALEKSANSGDWADIPLILSEHGLVRERADRWFRINKIKPNIHAQVRGHEAIVSMVGLGFGVGLVPRIVLDNSPLARRVRILDISHDMSPISIGLCILKRKLSNPLINAFWSLVVQSMVRK
jgi:LysR family transcriptional regulator, positive regulator for ilvC